MLFGSDVYDAIMCPGKQQLIHHISVLVRVRRKNHPVRVRKRLCVDFRGSGLRVWRPVSTVLRLRFNIFKREPTGDFQLCLWQEQRHNFERKSGRLKVTLWQPKQVFKQEHVVILTLTGNLTLKHISRSRCCQHLFCRLFFFFYKPRMPQW